MVLQTIRFFLLRRVLASHPRHLSHCTSGYLGVSFGLRSIGRCISSSRPIRQVFLAASTLVELRLDRWLGCRLRSERLLGAAITTTGWSLQWCGCRYFSS